jgi:hypothetical protein
MMRYSSPALGFAVEYPYGWEITIITPSSKDSLGRPYEAVEFVSDLYAGGEQVFGRYGITVAACPAVGMETITDTVEYALSPLSQTMRDQLKRRYLTVAGEPALELTSFPWERFGSRKIWVVHNELEYTLNFRPYMDFYTPSDTKARAAFDAFLRAFAFIPITETPSWQIPTPTPVPTPTSVPSTANLVCVSSNPVCVGEPPVRTMGQALGYESVFGFTLLNGQPFYFFQQDDAIDLSYAGQTLPYTYKTVIHNACCEAAMFNVGANDDMVWFHALRGGMWYYVEMGVYQ